MSAISFAMTSARERAPTFRSTSQETRVGVMGVSDYLY
jgi:hypothetical protein